MADTLTYEQCLALANEKVAELSTEESPVEIWSEKTTEKEFGWIFYPETKAFIETQDIMQKVPGITPILVDKYDSSCIHAPSSVEFDQFLKDYEERFREKANK